MFIIDVTCFVTTTKHFEIFELSQCWEQRIQSYNFSKYGIAEALVSRSFLLIQMAKHVLVKSFSISLCFAGQTLNRPVSKVIHTQTQTHICLCLTCKNNINTSNFWDKYIRGPIYCIYYVPSCFSLFQSFFSNCQEERNSSLAWNDSLFSFDSMHSPEWGQVICPRGWQQGISDFFRWNMRNPNRDN